MASSKHIAAAVLASALSCTAAYARPAHLLVVVTTIDMGAGSSKPSGGYLGVSMRDISDDECASLRLKDSRGALVLRVDHDGPAGKAGIRERDVILSVNGVTVEGEDDMRRMLRDTQPGRGISMVISRDGAVQTVTATVANREELEKQAWNQHWTVPAPKNSSVDEPPQVQQQAIPSRSPMARGFLSSHLLPTPVYTGATIDAIGPQLAEFFGAKDGKGVLVHEVDANSPAALAGLHAGDVITRVNGSAIGTTSEWSRIVRDSKGRAFSITVVRDHKEQTLTLTPDAKHRGQVDPTDLPPMAVILRLATFNILR